MTEREFCRDLKLTWQAFGLDTPEVLEQRQVDVQGLFGNFTKFFRHERFRGPGSIFRTLQLSAQKKI